MYWLPTTFVSEWWQNAFKMWEIAFAAPQVISHRTQRMLAAGYSPEARDQKEFARMGQEKMETFHESWNAIFLEWATLSWTLPSAAFQQWMKLTAFSPQQLVKSQSTLLHAAAESNKALSSSFSRVVEKGLHPVHRRATANAKRLGRARRK